jgi:hypothetical protein
MPISVFGAGMGRTGTYSLNIALEMLGFGPCHHMADVNSSPEQKQLWRAAGRGEGIDWEEAYRGFRSAVDWPTAHFWRELAAHYPAAKIILTLRSPDSWYKSVSETILQTAGAEADPASFGVAVIRNKIFGGRTDDALHCKAVYERHNAAVIAEIQPERLLVYRVAEGWPPLCAFLGVEIPSEAFPNTNTTEDFRSRFVGKR